MISTSQWFLTGKEIMLIAQRPIGNGEVKKSIDLLRNMMMYCTIDKYNSSIKVLYNMYYVHANSFFRLKTLKRHVTDYAVPIYGYIRLVFVIFIVRRLCK